MGNSSSPLVGTLLHDYPPDREGILLFVESQFQPVSCTCRSFGPHQEVRISLGDLDVSSSFDEIKLTSFTGVKGLHIVQYTVIRTSFNLTFTALDDDRPITCSVSSPGTLANKTERLINVIREIEDVFVLNAFTFKMFPWIFIFQFGIFLFSCLLYLFILFILFIFYFFKSFNDL